MPKTVNNGVSSIGTSVYDALCSALRDGLYKPGDRLREEEVAQRFEVSRTPVREAFGRLQARGLVEVAERRGLRVRELQVRDVIELYTMREVIEGAAAAIAASHALSLEVESLRDLNQAFERAQEDSRAMARINRLFHEAIYRMARNRYLDLALREVQDAIALLGTTTFTVPGRPALAMREHAKMIEAIQDRQSERAEALARAHIREALRARLRLLQDAGCN